MNRQLADDESWDEADDWRDADNDDDDSPTIPCPYCGREIYEDAPRCPYCGQYISDEDAPAKRPPWWVILGVLLCLCAILVWIAAGL